MLAEIKPNRMVGLMGNKSLRELAGLAVSTNIKKIAKQKVLCERCGFVPEWVGQLDVDHIDGNHNNNDPTNLQILCANCHRLKTHLSKDHMNAGQIGVRVIDDKNVVITNTMLPNK